MPMGESLVLMATSLSDQRSSKKDPSQCSEVPPPSGGLLSQIIGSAGRPTYRPGSGIAAPCLESVPSGQGYDVTPVELADFERSPTSVLRDRVATWLLQPLSQEEQAHSLDQDDLAQLKALRAAALRDIAGLSQVAVAEWIDGPSCPPVRRRALLHGAEAAYWGETRVIRGRTATGRRLWASLGAWPWWPLAGGLAGVDELKGGLPREWWKRSDVIDTWNAWRAHPAPGPKFSFRAAATPGRD